LAKLRVAPFVDKLPLITRPEFKLSVPLATKLPSIIRFPLKLTTAPGSICNVLPAGTVIDELTV